MPRNKTNFAGLNVVRNSVANIALPAAAFITAPLLARALGVDGRGEMAAATSIVTVMTAVATFGIPEAITNTVARTPVLRRSALWQGFLLLIYGGVFSTLVAVALAFVLANGDRDLASLMVICALSIAPTVAIGALRGVASGMQKWSEVNNEKYLQAGIKAVLLGGLASLGLLSVQIAAVIFVYAPVVAAIAFLPLWKNLRRNANPRGNSKKRDLASYGGRFWLGSVSGIVLSRIDQVLMIPLAGPAQLGLYAAAVNVGDVTLLVNNAVRDLAFSTQSAKADKDRLAAAARRSFLVSLVLSACLAMPLPWLFPIIFGDDFSGGTDAALILLAGATLGVPGSVAGAGLGAFGRPELRSLSLAISAAVNVLLVVALVPVLGATGAAIATLIGNVLAANLNLVFMRWQFGIRPTAFYAVRRDDFAAIAAVGIQLLRIRTRRSL
jgi:O-antigen/teichoic acid export membrane protein